MIDDAANDREIAEHLLNSDHKETTLHIGDDDLKIYLNCAAKLSVTMETVAEEMLDDYYLAVRSVRPGGFECILVGREFIFNFRHFRCPHTKSLLDSQADGGISRKIVASQPGDCS